MAIDYEHLLHWPIPDALQDYTARDCVIYALGLDYGSAPLDPRHLRHVYERDLQPIPSMVLTLATGGSWSRDPGTGIDYTQLLHAEQSFRLHRPLPVQGHVQSRSRVVAITDKGDGRGAIVTAERQLFIDGAADPAATLVSSLFCRADGGFGGPASGGPAPRPVPEGDFDAVSRLAVPRNLALIYRLSGDYNELHCDPEVAAKAGFAAPILHGLCSFGLAIRSVVEALDIAPAAVAAGGSRFTAPVFPGETLETHIWRHPGGAAFRTRVVERDRIVLNNGWMEYAS